MSVIVPMNMVVWFQLGADGESGLYVFEEDVAGNEGQVVCLYEIKFDKMFTAQVNQLCTLG